MQRLRVTYSVDGPLRFASHLERARVWERAVRRAGLPLAYSGGFNPRPRMQVAAALPVGFAAQGEMLDLWFEQPVDPAIARSALARALPEGLHIVQVEEIAPAEPPLQTRVTAAVYTVTVETTAPLETIRGRVTDLLAAQALPRQRRGRSYDLRPLIQRLSVQAGRPGKVVLEMELAAREGATGRPEEVVDALGLAEDSFRVRRERLLTQPVACQ
jgi:radical SAM-linked protein